MSNYYFFFKFFSLFFNFLIYATIILNYNLLKFIIVSLFKILYFTRSITRATPQVDYCYDIYCNDMIHLCMINLMYKIIINFEFNCEKDKN